MRVKAWLVLFSTLLLVVSVCVGQPARAQAPAPAATAASGDMGDDLASPWHDAVHYFGLANAALASLTFLGGLTLFLGFEVRGKKWKDPVRLKLRYVHMAAGVLAVAAGLTHYVARSVQGGQFWWGPNPPTWAMVGFLVLLISGILRYKKPWAVMPWLHRASVVVALYYLTRHSLYQYHKFMGPRA